MDSIRYNLFLEKARKAHGNKYDYSHVDFVRKSDHVKILCPHHGPFTQSVENHTRKTKPAGCKACGIEVRRQHFKRTNDEFIGLSKEKFGNLFDYSLVDYINQDTKITLVCKTHGEFTVTPVSHLQSPTGCPRCSKEACDRDRIMPFSIVHGKLKSVHGDKYRFIENTYKGTDSKISFACPIHGQREQHVYNLLNGHGCSMCDTDTIRTIDDFQFKLNTLYGDMFKVLSKEWQGQLVPHWVMCRYGHKLNIPPRIYYNLYGCPKCNDEKETTAIYLIYLGTYQGKNVFKYGTSIAPKGRLKHYRVLWPKSYILDYWFVDKSISYFLEKQLGEKLQGGRLPPEMLPEGFTETRVVNYGVDEYLELTNTILKSLREKGK